MAERFAIEDEMLDTVTGGSVTAVYTAATRSGTVTSDQVAGTWTFTAEHKRDVMMYLAQHNIGYTDLANIEHMEGEKWITRID